MANGATENLRTVALLSHSGSGKTMLGLAAIHEGTALAPLQCPLLSPYKALGPAGASRSAIPQVPSHRGSL